jgi:hypothetical protein
MKNAAVKTAGNFPLATMVPRGAAALTGESKKIQTKGS